MMLSCKKEGVKKTDYSVVKLQLQRMVKNDQAIQFAHTPNETQKVKDSLYKEQERIFIANTDTIKSLFNKYNFLGFDKVGESGSQDFWLLVQHADHDVAFQEKVLKSMKKEVLKNNADNSNFAYLTDRVLTNKGQKQYYGTQLNYTNDMWIVPKPIQDSMNVDVRRKKIGLKSLKDYLNSAMKTHFEMNKKGFEKMGITKPRQYE
ncbi:hypothetical protein WH52_05190 [Tenacibaculum holothuriorum]|uniref:Uncharacterized protein n=2 Tax=Tenacibaculum holothuriorum TaxID=1635173 RepID=A0A1Y2PDC7_9FLAO|nr:hypothetical protein WH52_05190 [Tenacibaculum holothuriorum]